jgi:HlyD family secretion protein
MERKKKRRVWYIVLIVAISAGLAAYLYARNGKKSAEKYRTETVTRGDIVMAVNATGSVSAKTTVQIGSQVSGIVGRLHADFNTPVRKGQILAELDPTPFLAQLEQRRADVARARVQMENARTAYARQQRLLDAGLASEADFDSAKAAYESANAQLEQAVAAHQQAETNVGYTRIISPVDGVVVDRQYDVGQTVAASFQAPTLFTIAEDLTQMQVQADVDQSDIGRIREGQVARFTVDAYPEQEFEGRVEQIRLNATTNQNVITYPVIIGVENPELKLRPQMTANITMEVARADDVLRVANAALRFRPETVAGAGGPAARGAGAPAAGGAGQRPAGGPAAGGEARQRREGGGDPAMRTRGGEKSSRGGRGAGQVVYTLVAGELEPVTIRPGLSDGRFTEVVGGGLKEGDAVVVGAATAQRSGAQGFPGMGGPGGAGRPGGGRPR